MGRSTVTSRRNRPARSRTSVRPPTSATSTVMIQATGVNAVTIARRRPVPKARRQVPERPPTPTRRAAERTSHGRRTTLTAVPIRPPDNAPVTTGSVA